MNSSSPRGPRSALIVEDEHVMRRVLIAALEDAGFGPLGVSNLAGAREALSREVPALLVLDLSLEGEFGAELLAELALRPDPPCVLVCSAFPLADVVAARFGVELLRKPFELDHLVIAAERAIAAQRRPSMPTKTR